MSNFYAKGEDYTVPTTSNYFRFEEGDNVFRFLGAFSEGSAIQGFEYWKTVKNERTPIRVKKGTHIDPSELEMNKFGKLDTPKYFWAVPVWNYQEKRVQILEITQTSILNSIKKVIDNPKWGDPRDYDFIVTKAKNGEKTVYTVTNNPKEKLDKTIIDQFINTPIDLEALFLGGDPFAASNKSNIDDADELSLVNDVDEALG